MTLYKWSQTASADANADSTINWAEGQAPSSINDSARAMMAATAKYRDDIAGAILTAGISTAYTLASFQVFDTLAHLNGQMVAFTPHVTNGATVTLNVDSLGAKPLRTSPGVELQAGTIIQGTPYVATYNNNDGAFYLRGFFGNPYNVPLAGGMDFWGTTVPNSSFAFPFGQAISRVTYASLFAIMGTAYGVGDGSTTFNLPDKRGRVSVALDNMGGTAANRVTTGGSGVNGDVAGSSGGAETYTQLRSDLPNVSPTFTGSSGSVVVTGTQQVGLAPTPGETSFGGGSNSVSTGGGITLTSTGTFTPAGIIQSLNGNVTQTAMKTLPPAIVVPYIMRII
ncbi:MAG TPA: phage tail protein [Bradyrhizobium sp.]|nr:phage tail protein [Bradyrhizobium sp.]